MYRKKTLNTIGNEDNGEKEVKEKPKRKIIKTDKKNLTCSSAALALAGPLDLEASMGSWTLQRRVGPPVSLAYPLNSFIPALPIPFRRRLSIHGP